MSGSVTIHLPPLTAPQSEWLALHHAMVFKRSEDFEKLEVLLSLTTAISANRTQRIPRWLCDFLSAAPPEVHRMCALIDNWPLFFKLSDILASWKLLWTERTTPRFDLFVSLASRHIFPSPTAPQRDVLAKVIHSTCLGSITLFNELYGTLYESRRLKLSRLPVEDLRNVNKEWMNFEEGLMRELEAEVWKRKGARTRMVEEHVPGIAPFPDGPDAPDLTVMDFMAHSEQAWDQ
ncbi:hypothetical protein JCM1840_003746 [Sporobolomyces johnsonii]